MSGFHQPSAPVAAKKSSGVLGSLFGRAKTTYLIAIVFSLAAAAGVFMILGRSADRTTYYVLNQDVPARTQIVSSMLTEVDTAAGTEPPTALTPGSVITQAIFAKVPLRAGDTITESVAGPLDRINANLPENYVVTSFKVDPENAVAGKIRRGDLIDVIAVPETDGGKVAKVVLHRVLVLDVTTDPSTIASAATDESVSDPSVAPGPESAAVRGGIPYLYTVAVLPEDAARIAVVRGDDLLVTLSSNQASGNGLDVLVDSNRIYAPGPVGDSSAGVDLAAVRGEAAAGAPAEGDGADAGASSAPATPSASP
jgi:Flp pilus assembly protein CpaB